MATKQATRDLIAALGTPNGVEIQPRVSKRDELLAAVRSYGAQDGVASDSIIHAFSAIFAAAKGGYINEGVDASTSKELYGEYLSAKLGARAFGTVEEAADAAKSTASQASKFNAAIKVAQNTHVGYDFISYAQGQASQQVSSMSLYERIVKICRAQTREDKHLLSPEEIAELFAKAEATKSLAKDLDALFRKTGSIAKEHGCNLDAVKAAINDVLAKERIVEAERALQLAREEGRVAECRNLRDDMPQTVN